MLSFYGGAFFILCALAAAGWSGNAYAQNTIVAAPCSDNPTQGLKSCQEFLVTGTPAFTPEGSASPIPSFPPVTGTAGQVYLQMKTSILGNPAVSVTTYPTPLPSPAPIRGYYQHVDPGSTISPQPYLGPTICNLVPGSFNNNMAEGLNPQTPVGGINNQLGDSCGNPIDIACAADGCYKSNCSSFLGVPVFPCHPTPTFVLDKSWNDANPSLSHGTLEDGYTRGGIVAATSCYMNEVLSEVKSKKQLTIKDEGGLPGPCASVAQAVTLGNGTLASDVQNLKNSLSTMGGDSSVAALKNLQNALTGAADLTDIVNCNKTGSGFADGPARQAAQQLCGHRFAVETAFIQLVACEVFARAQYSYFKQVGSPQGQKNIQTMLNQEIQVICQNYCQTELKPSLWHPPSDQQVRDCANACYIKNMPPAFQTYLKNLWPGDGAACDPITLNNRISRVSGGDFV